MFFVKEYNILSTCKNKMKKVLICVLVIFLTIGCSLTSIPFCELDSTFSMEFTNGTNDPYELYINGSYQQIIPGKSKVTYDIPAGYWSAKVVQRLGFTTNQINKTYSDTNQSCTNYYIVF